jgi:tetratricopeptide (TPR) repeat protein
MNALLAFLFFSAQVDMQSLLQEGLEDYGRGEYRRAIEKWDLGLAEARKQKDELFAGSFLGNIGVAWAGLKDYEKAAAALEESVRVGEAAGDRQGLKTRLNALASLYLLRERPTEALPLYRRALELALDLEDKKLEIDILGNLGLAYLAVGNHVQAANHMKMAAEAGEGKDRTRDTLRLAALLQECGDVAGSLAALKAIAADLEPGSRDAEAAARLAATNSAIAAGGPEALRRARIEGLKRMLERLRKFQQEALAAEVERQIAALGAP